jgi:hypothetical protein
MVRQQILVATFDLGRSFIRSNDWQHRKEGAEDGQLFERVFYIAVFECQTMGLSLSKFPLTGFDLSFQDSSRPARPAPRHAHRHQEVDPQEALQVALVESG